MNWNGSFVPSTVRTRSAAVWKPFRGGCHHRNGADSRSRRRCAVPERATVCSVAGAGATAARHGRQDEIGSDSKRGDPYLRTLLVHGARSVIFWRLRRDGPGAPRLQARVAEKSVNVVAVAMANHNARIAWAMVRRGEPYRDAGTAAQDRSSDFA